MSLIVEKTKRVFKYNNETLSDPDPTMTIGEVLDYYSDTYPEMINSTISEPTVTVDTSVFVISSSFKEKG